MMRVLRRSIVTLVVLGALAAVFLPQTAWAQDNGPRIPVAGQTIQISAASPPVFRWAGPNIVGNSAPIFFICPGDITPTFSCNFASNGFLGTVTADERVVRHLASKNKRPQFTFKATQVFSGTVVIGADAYKGTFVQTMSLRGDLNEVSPVTGRDCREFFEDAQCGARNFSGTWAITGNGTGDLAKLRGQGTLVWNGCAPDFSDFPACLPRYEGSISFAGGVSSSSTNSAAMASAASATAGPNLYVPLVSK